MSVLFPVSLAPSRSLAQRWPHQRIALFRQPHVERSSGLELHRQLEILRRVRVRRCEVRSHAVVPTAAVCPLPHQGSATRCEDCDRAEGTYLEATEQLRAELRQGSGFGAGFACELGG